MSNIWTGVGALTFCTTSEDGDDQHKADLYELQRAATSNHYLDVEALATVMDYIVTDINIFIN